MRCPSSTLVVFLAVLFCLDCQDPSDPPATSATSQTPPGTPNGSPVFTFGASMSEARSQPAAAVLDGIVYVAGGGDDDGAEWEGPASVLAYDPVRDTWRTAGQLVRPVAAAAMAAIGNRLYLVGGCPLDSATSLQVFEPATGQVTVGPPLPTPRCLPSVAVLGGRLHVIGGVHPGIDPDFPIWDDTEEHDIFDPGTGTWSVGAPMPHARSGHGAVTLDGKIYVAGGQGELLQVYDPATDAWTTYESPPARWGVATVAFEGTMYVVGGGEYQTACCSGPIPSAVVQRFDPATGVWDSVASLSAGRMSPAAALVGRTIYVIGGSSTGGGALDLVELIRVP